MLDKIGTVWILFFFPPHIFVFVYTQRMKAEPSSFCQLWVPSGLPQYMCTQRMRSQKSLFSATTPAARPTTLNKASAHSKSNFQQQACSFQSLLCLVYASLLWVLQSSNGSQFRKATMLVSLSVFALVTCQHTHSHSGKQLCSLVCILESHKDEVLALSISRRDTWYLVDPLFFPDTVAISRTVLFPEVLERETSLCDMRGFGRAWCPLARLFWSNSWIKVRQHSAVWFKVAVWYLFRLFGLTDGFNKMAAIIRDSLDKDCFVL